MEAGEPPLRKEAHSPGEFLAAQRRFLHLMYLDNHCVDIEGQLAAGQFATADLLVRTALDQGIIVFLLRRGEAGCCAHNAWALLRRACGEEAPVYRRALALSRRTPQTAEEIVDYVRECLAFVATELGAEPSGYHSKQSFAEYIANTQGIGRLVRLLKSERRQ